MTEEAKKPILESMTKLVVNKADGTGFLSVRIWREEESHRRFFTINNDDIRALVDERKAWEADELLAMLELVPRVSAIEITHSGGNGVVAYTDWP